MICPNCNSNNIEGSSFCVKCGANLKEIQSPQPTQSNHKPLINNPESNIPQQQVVQEAPKIQNSSVGTINYIAFIIAMLQKPFKTFKAEESKLSDTKNSAMITVIIAALMVVINLVKSMISAVFVKTMDYSTFKYTTTVDFSRLKDLNYLELIGKNLLIYVAVMAGIALVYYIISMIFKKNANYIKMLSISSISLIPFILLGMIVSPLVGFLWNPLAMVATFLGATYTFLIFINLMDEELVFDSLDEKIYFHTICLTIILCAGYYIYTNLIVRSITKSISNFLQ